MREPWRFGAIIGITAVVASLALPALAAPAAPRSAQAATAATARPVYQLWSVSCPAAAKCLALGGTFTVSNGDALVRLWNGKSWTAQRPLLPHAYLGAISCRYPRQCTAVGMTTAQHALALRWNGRTWREQRAPGNSSNLLSVSCPSATTCVAVGIAGSSGVAELWNGRGWFSRALPVSAYSIDRGMGAVSCSAVANCTALGEQVTGQDIHQPLAEHWDGTAWTEQVMPGVADTAEFVSVSCPNTGACVAVGNSPIDEGPLEPLAAAWSRAGWKLLPAAPHPDTYAALNGVSCTSARFCLAVGAACSPNVQCEWAASTPGVTGLRALALRWNGRKWTTLRTPAPADTSLISVSCSSWRACTAVGRSGSGLVAERWNGARWARQRVPGAG